MLASIVIRTYNEGKHLQSLLQKLSEQKCAISHEIVIVDSGSTDNTLAIAASHNVSIVNLAKEEFTFGKSLNYGCEAASGDYLVFISGHCVPKNNDWLKLLLQPLSRLDIAYTYGRQIGNIDSKFSECQLFKKYYPSKSAIPQNGFFCNNANAALKKTIWQRYPFNEELTGLEDMELGRRLRKNNLQLAYVAEASVYHLHDETWNQILIRYKREAVALRHVMPDVYVRLSDFFRFFISAVMMDFGAVLKQKQLWKHAGNIIGFRLLQYWGSYRGNHEYKKMTSRLREEYFYPK